ncbi:MAG: glycosyltransferase family 2 protein [Methylococcaceae bacterium]|nr:glycosyltransferase family 2 protein [Methylococcaceae bacterium]
MQTRKVISIIIPVYNDSIGLKKCLEKIQKQSYPIHKVETVVVDNASATSPQTIVYSFPFAKYLYEEKPGSYAARNKGMSIASGKYLVFLDADCTPEPDWLEKGIKCLEEAPDKTLIGGEVKFIPSKKPTATELYQLIVGFQQKENIEQKKFSVTANLFIKKKDALNIGTFEEELLSGGDRDWCWRALNLGITITYCKKAVVKTPPRRLLKNAIKQTRRVAGGRYSFQQLKLTENPVIVNRLKPARTNLQSLAWIIQHPQLSSINRVKVLNVAIFLKLITIVEKWRLKHGSKAERY